MTYLTTKFSNFFTKKENTDNVFAFFFETKAREKKRIYTRALQKAQLEQQETLKAADLK